MTIDPERPLAREEVLAGLTGRRASTVLHAIESRTAFLCTQARHAAAPAICETFVEQRERAFLSALATGRGRQDDPPIQQLERFAPQWAHLVPDDAAGRAELAGRLGAKYRFTAAAVPRLRAVLGLDTADVAAAYRQRTGDDLATIYRPRLTRTERLRWMRARSARALAELPPFWAAFGLTLTETVGAGTLALPIALAGLGPLPGVVLIVLLGGVNALTIAAVAETFTRSGRVRWGGAYLGRVVAALLGRFAAGVFTAGLFVFALVALLAYFVGFATTLAAGTPVAAPVWAALLFAAVLILLQRGGLDATIASALVVGAVNIVAIVGLSAMALPHGAAANLLHAEIPLVAGRPLDGAVLGAVLGVVLFAFFGHTSIANCARVVLHREPSGRALVRGAVLATVTAVGLYALWVVAVGGAVAPQRLAAEPGTALVPLAEVVGVPALVVGTVFAVLAMGMAAVHFSLGLSNQVREWLGGPTWVGLAPLVAVFVLVEVLLVAQRESFTAQLGVLGTVTLPLLAGVFPVLLLVAARRRGDQLPAVRPRWLGGGVLVGGLYVLFLGALAVHGLVIWQEPALRVLALAVVGVVGLVTVAVLRGGALVAGTAVEARRDAETGLVRMQFVDAGEPFRAPVRVWLRDGATAQCTPEDGVLDLPPDAVAVEVELASAAAGALTVRLHEVGPENQPVPLPGPVCLDGSRLPLHDGYIERLLPGPGARLHLTVGGGTP